MLVFGAICGRSGLYFEYIGKMLRLLFVPGCDIERLKTRLLTDLKLLPSMKNLIDKSELISKLQTLEGLSNDERSSLIGLLREHKKYGLVWEDKPEDVEERLRELLPVLREVKDKAILSDEPDAPNHILIEGDKL